MSTAMAGAAGAAGVAAGVEAEAEAEAEAASDGALRFCSLPFLILASKSRSAGCGVNSSGHESTIWQPSSECGLGLGLGFRLGFGFGLGLTWQPSSE